MDKEEMYIRLSYRDLEAEMEGELRDVWKTINHLFAKIEVSIEKQAGAIDVGQLNVSEVIVELRDREFLNEVRDRGTIFQRLQELGKTDISKEAVSMALKRLVTAGELKRRQVDNQYFFYAPWVEWDDLRNKD